MEIIIYLLHTGNVMSALDKWCFIFLSDIAIGAPYEDEGLGAVYIYNGYRDGLWHQYSQRIAATALAVPGLQGFGISFANAADINSDDINGRLYRLYYIIYLTVCHHRHDHDLCNK